MKGERKMQYAIEDENSYRRTVKLLGFGLLFFLAFLFSISLVLAFINGLLQGLGIGDTGVKVIYQLSYGILYAVAFICPIPIMRSFLGSNWKPVRHENGFSPYLPMIVVGGIVLIFAQSYINASVVSIFNFADIFESSMPSTDGKMSNLDIGLTVFTLAVVPAVSEELLFRGAILGNLTPYGHGTAILVSALSFSLMHQNFAQFLYAFGAGILLGIVYDKTHNILNCIILHFFNNLSSVISTVLTERLDAKNANLVIAIIDTALILLGLLSIVILIFRLSKKTTFSEGMFEKALPEASNYTERPIARTRSVKLIFASPYGVYLITCVIMGIFTAFTLSAVGSLS